MDVTNAGYRESRYLIVGEVDEQVIAVIWTPRENEIVRRIISTRPASKGKEALP